MEVAYLREGYFMAPSEFKIFWLAYRREKRMKVVNHVVSHGFPITYYPHQIG
jgi:hypothetical protein